MPQPIERANVNHTTAFTTPSSFFSAAMISEEPTFKACAVTGTCYDPGGVAIFDEASPTFKKRFMFMSGIVDEAEFEKFRKTIDWHGFAGKIKAPFLILTNMILVLCLKHS